MRRHLALLAAVAAVVGAAVFAPVALANSFAVSIGVPGLAVGYGNHGGYVAAYVPPPAYYAPPAYTPYYDYAPAPVYYGAPVVYGRAAYYRGYRPYYHHYRHW